MAFDAFLEIDGIKGESKDDKHKDAIDVEAFSWGLANPPRGNGRAGKPSFQDFSFVAPVSVASPNLMLACASGQHIEFAELVLRRQGEKQSAEFLTIKMTEVLVSGYTSGGAEEGPGPTDQVALSFSKVEYSYSPQNDDGSAGAAVSVGWDLGKNVKI